MFTQTNFSLKLVLLLLLLTSTNLLLADGGIGYKGVKLNLNGTNTWYNVHGVNWGYQGCGDYGSTFYNSDNANWNGTNLGTFDQNATLQLTGYAVVGWANAGDYIAGKLEYKVWKQGDSEPTGWEVINIGNYQSPTSGASQVQCSSNNDRVVGFNNGTTNFKPSAPGIYNFKVKGFGRVQYTGGGGGSFNVNDGSELTATFTIRPTVTFDANSGSGTMASQNVGFNSATTLTSNSFTRSGYTFSGWNTAANGSGTSYANSASVTLTANTTLYAQWTINTTPTITVNTTGFTAAFGNQCLNVASSNQTYTVEGTGLTNDITVTAPTGFQVSTSSGSGFGSSVTLTQSGGSVASTAIYVRFNHSSAGAASGNITHTSTGATQQNVAVSGTGVAVSVGGTASAEASAVCPNGTTTLSLLGQTGTIQWQQSADGTNGWANVSGGSGATTTSYTTAALTTTTFYRAAVTNSPCAIDYSNVISVTVNARPEPTGATGANVCTSGTASLSVVDPGAGLTVDWYAAVSGGSVLSGGTGTLSFTTPSISTTTTYYAETRNTTTGCVSSSRTAVTATVVSPLDWVNTQFPTTTQTICASDSLTAYGQVYEAGLTNTTSDKKAPNIEAWLGYSSSNSDPSGSGWTWKEANFNDASAGNNNDEYVAILSGLSGGTYYYAWRYRRTGCDFQYGGTSGIWGNTGHNVQLNVNALPAITNHPSAAITSYCQNASATALSVTATGAGLTYQWYSNTANSNTGGTLISSATSASYTPPTNSAGTTYYYCVVSGTCSVTSSVSGAITVNPRPTVSISNQVNDPCMLGAGQVTVTGSGGTGALSITWTATAHPSRPVGATGSATGTPSGATASPSPTTYTNLTGWYNYNFLVTDANGCTATQ